MNDSEAVHGLMGGSCRHCDHGIPQNTLDCPNCGKRRMFDQDEYDALLRCSSTGDVTEWNDWRRAMRDDSRHILHLEGADLSGANLQQVDLSGGYLQDASLYRARLEGANLFTTYLARTHFGEAHLEGANLDFAELPDANGALARLTGASLTNANLKNAALMGTYFRDAQCYGANFKGAYLWIAHMEGACLSHARLEGANLRFAHLEGAQAAGAFVDSTTVLRGCTFDRRTDFTGVGLGGAHIEPALKSVLQRNVRQIGWHRWYDQSALHKWILSLPVRTFWWASDYGSSTVRIMLVFLLLSVAFAGSYYWGELVRSPGFVTNLSAQAGHPVPTLLVPLRALYFSVVTMTTLGFGDIHAHAQSYAGHILLMGQVILGYMLLGALITRFAIMFQGTSVPFTREPPEEPEESH